MKREAFHVAMLGGTIVLCGCPQYRDADVPNPIVQELNPKSESPYFIYVPSHYSHDAQWPLVILCHGTKPWDTAQRQMLDWVKLAEERSFIVAAPELIGTTAVPMPSAKKQAARQLEDERRILSTVRHIKGAYSVSEDRVFMTGWSAGSFAVMFTGMRNSDVFRAIAIQQGNFRASYVTELEGNIDPHQPICVIYGALDVLTGKDAKLCIDWLEAEKANLYRREVSGGHRGHPEPTQEFFENALRNDSWLHIRCMPLDAEHPLTIRFKIKSSFKPLAYRWDFGDGGDSPVSEPIHTYEAPGAYRVKLRVAKGKRGSVSREIDLTVPQLDTLIARPSSWDRR